MNSYLQNFKYELAGHSNGLKLVFLHGLMGSAANWRRIAPAFYDQFQVLTYDQRGHGGSFKPDSGYTPEDYALDLNSILDDLGWDKIVLVGHSMGGRNALQFAQNYPQRLMALVVEDIGPEGNPVAMQKTLDLINMVPTPFADKRAAKVYLTTEFVEKLAGQDNAKVLGQYFYTNIETRTDGSADWRFAKEAILASLSAGHAISRWDVVRNLEVPTLFIRGESSEEFPRDEYQKVLASNSKIKGVEVKDAGHWVHSDQPLEFIKVLREFLVEALGF